MTGPRAEETDHDYGSCHRSGIDRTGERLVPPVSSARLAPCLRTAAGLRRHTQESGDNNGFTAAIAEAPATIEACWSQHMRKLESISPLSISSSSIPQGAHAGADVGLRHGQSKVVGGTTTNIVAIANDEVQAGIRIERKRSAREVLRLDNGDEIAEKPASLDWKLDATTGDVTSAPTGGSSPRDARREP
jgi:hypothetical protein